MVVIVTPNQIRSLPEKDYINEFFFFKKYCMSMNILPTCIVYAPPTWSVGKKVKHNVRSLKTGVLDGCELPCAY